MFHGTPADNIDVSPNLDVQPWEFMETSNPPLLWQTPQRLIYPLWIAIEIQALHNANLIKTHSIELGLFFDDKPFLKDNKIFTE